MNAPGGPDGTVIPLQPVVDHMQAVVDDMQDVVIDLEVTSACDAVCQFCPREFMPDKKRMISLDVVNRLAEELQQIRVLTVVLCGIGESTLHPQLDVIIKTLAATGNRVEMTTHGGARMDARRFESLIAAGLCGFNFSVNAGTPDTHNRVMKLKDFEKTVANLQGILALRQRSYPHVAVHVSFVVCSLNHHEIGDFVEFWRPQEPSTIWLHPVNNRNGLLNPDVRSIDMGALASRYANDERVVVDLLGGFHEEDRVCKIANKMVFISADGDVRLCALDYRRQVSYGNVLNKGLRDIHHGKIRRYLNGETQAFCRGCDFCPAGLKGEPLEVRI